MQLRTKLGLKEKPYKLSCIIDGISGGILGILLMYFSIQVASETIIDLRFIPVMLMMLFSGIPPTIISALIIIGGRFLFGVNSSSLAAAILMIILIIGFVLIHSFFKKLKPEATLYERGLVMIVFTNLAFSIVISFLLQDVDLLLSLIPLYWILLLLGGIITIFFTEYIRKTQLLLLKYEQESTMDFLTGLNNVRQFDTIWNSLLHSAAAKSENLSLLIIDIDHFKSVNDTYGHSVGDQVLKELGKVLTDTCRSFDVISRNGGEEFSVILRDCSHRQATTLAERIRKAVSAHQFPISSTETIHVTVSIGVATYPDQTSEGHQLFGIADDYLYKAKRTGRNKVCAN